MKTTGQNKQPATAPRAFDVALLKSFTPAFEGLRKRQLLNPTLEIDELLAVLDDAQKQVVQQILELNPEDYGVTIPHLGIEPVPADLVAVSGQQYQSGGETKTLADKLVPRKVYEAFQRMNDAFMAAHPDRRLLVESGYRSPAWQVITFINWCLKAYGGDIAQTIRHASPPAYSQHTSASKTALDILNIDGLPSAEHLDDFKNTIEYAWLTKNANQFGFYESWPEGNTSGIRSEPWHWQYRPQQ